MILNGILYEGDGTLGPMNFIRIFFSSFTNRLRPTNGNPTAVPAFASMTKWLRIYFWIGAFRNSTLT